MGTILDVDPSPDATTQRVLLTVDYDEESFRARHGGECATIGDASATLGSLDLEQHSPGENDEDFGGCRGIDFTAVASVGVHAAARMLEIRDGSTTIVAEVPAGMFEARNATVTSHATARFHYGDELVAEWSHLEDLDRNDPFNGAGVWWQRGEQVVQLENVTVDGTTIRARFPATGSLDGDGLLKFGFGRDTTDVAICSATRCSFRDGQMYEMRARLD